MNKKRDLDVCAACGFDIGPQIQAYRSRLAKRAARARAASQTPEERSEIARRAGMAPKRPRKAAKVSA